MSRLEIMLFMKTWLQKIPYLYQNVSSPIIVAEFIWLDYPRLILCTLSGTLGGTLTKDPVNISEPYVNISELLWLIFKNTSFAARVILFQWDAVNVNWPFIQLKL